MFDSGFAPSALSLRLNQSFCSCAVDLSSARLCYGSWENNLLQKSPILVTYSQFCLIFSSLVSDSGWVLSSDHPGRYPTSLLLRCSDPSADDDPWLLRRPRPRRRLRRPATSNDGSAARAAVYPAGGRGRRRGRSGGMSGSAHRRRRSQQPPSLAASRCSHVY